MVEPTQPRSDELAHAAAVGWDLAVDLPPLDVTGRAERCVEVLGDGSSVAADGERVDAIALGGASDRRWLTGLDSSDGLVLVADGVVTLVVDPRYADAASDLAGVLAGEVAVAVAEQGQDLWSVVPDLVGPTASVGRLGLVAADTSWAGARRLSEAWSGDLVPARSPLVGLRALKSSAEVARIARAAAITDLALANCLGSIRPGTSERAFALALEVAMRRSGADGVGYELIVAAGPNAARPHARPGERRFVAGDLLVLDIGANVEGYRSDMTRTFAVGTVSRDRRALVEAVIEAQAVGVSAVADGVAAVDVDRACRSHLADAGLARFFTHATGHGVGLDIHEPLRCSATSDDVLAASNTVTVEPGCYLDGDTGCRIEDTLLVLDDGALALTRTPKDPFCVGSVESP